MIYIGTADSGTRVCVTFQNSKIKAFEDAQKTKLEARAEDRYPCSSRYTTGVSNVMGLAIPADPEVLYRAIIDGSGGTANPALVRAIANNGKRAMSAQDVGRSEEL